MKILLINSQSLKSDIFSCSLRANIASQEYRICIKFRKPPWQISFTFKNWQYPISLMKNTKQKPRYGLKNRVHNACRFWLEKINNNDNFLCLKKISNFVLLENSEQQRRKKCVVCLVCTVYLVYS